MAIQKFQIKTQLTMDITRWQVVLLGWHCLTFYRWVYGETKTDSSVSWWVYLGEDFGFGIHLPRSFSNVP